MKGGSPYNTDEVFYAVVFADRELSESLSDVIELKMGGSNSVSQTVSVPLVGESMTVYVAETDIEGVPIKSSSDFEISLNKESVTFTQEKLSDSVAITNTFPEETETPSTQPRTPQGNNTPGSSSPGSNVRTGDESPILEYALVAIVCLVLIGCMGVGERRRRK